MFQPYTLQLKVHDINHLEIEIMTFYGKTIVHYYIL